MANLSFDLSRLAIVRQAVLSVLSTMVTQAQIASKLGVSRQLVTFALAGYPQVAKESRERILAKALEMGYRPNPHARALRSKKTGIIALWIPDQISTHYTHVARELSRLVKATGHELIISEVGVSDMKQIWSHVPVDGIVAVDASKAVQTELEALAMKKVPLVSLGAYASDTTDHVQVDLHAGTMEVMAHLIGSGSRRIAHATFVRRSLPHESRRLGYVAAMKNAGLKAEFIHYPLSENQRPVARQLIQDYVRNHGLPEAIFCHSDDVALGIYRGLCDAGISVPGEIALVGCDGIEDTEYLECPLTTLVQPVAEMCATAWGFLQQRLEERTRPPQQAILRPTLAVRESSRRPV
ncbi:MAG: LacI family DNA-binding transcriptional regulator [Akkermansiaceae bacterium]